MPNRPSPAWLTDAVLYQIYPQSYADSNGDGIGDFGGLAERLEYLSWLGVDAVWLGPCFVSPFRDAGYDVADYMTTAPRYGTNDDLAALADTARGMGIRVMLDLVAGHTSDQHPWFRAAIDDPDDHRYIWSDRQAEGFVASPGTRPGFYLPNFFEVQPALNFGYARQSPDEPWRQPIDAEGPLANREALREIMAHWLDLGLSGFRVDMAASLIKDDPGHVETGKLWTALRGWLDAAYPDAALLSEWGDPAVSVPAGFHADFFLQFGGTTNGEPLRSLWSNRTGTVDPIWPPLPCYFDAEGEGSMTTFLDAWRRTRDTIGDGGGGLISLPTSNHDFSRLCCGPRTAEQLAPAFAFQLTWPTLPAIYYGDEIGMRYVPDLPVHEGSALSPTWNRAGSRTPMQWDGTANAGFSTADHLYLPLDPDPDRPNVAAQRADEGSLLHLVRRLIALRRAHPALGTRGDVEVLATGYPFAYVRGGAFLVVVNPRREPATLPWDRPPGTGVAVRGVTVENGEIRADGFSYGVFEL